MEEQGRRKSGRPKRRWLDKVKDGIKDKGLSAIDVYDCTTWTRMSSYIDPILPSHFLLFNCFSVYLTCFVSTSIGYMLSDQ